MAVNSQLSGKTDFDPAKDIPSLAGKVILVTGGTAGLGAESIRAFAAHDPAYIYFTGRNVAAANALISELNAQHPRVGLSFIKMDLSSLRSVKDALAKDFKHDRLDILLNNAGIVAKPPSLSVDGYEIQFATNHLGHAMVTKQLLPYLLKAANEPDSDVRIVNNTSDGYEFHHAIKGGIAFADLDRGSTMSKWVLGPWIRYAQSKLANILFATEFARRYPQITSVSIHPGVVETTMITDMATGPRYFNATACWLAGVKFMEPHQGAWSQLWCSAGAKKEELRNGGFYRPVGRDCWVEKEKPMTKLSKDEDLAKRLWNWTEEVLERFS